VVAAGCLLVAPVSHMLSALVTNAEPVCQETTMNEQNDLTTSTRTRHIAYWVTTMLVAAEFASGGVIDLLHSTIFGTQDLGYPAYFGNIIGVWKILGAAALLAPHFPLLKEWAYAGMFFTMTGAVATQIAVGDEGVAMAAAVIFTCLVIASWALRPSSRRLPETSLSRGSAGSSPSRRFNSAFSAPTPRPGPPPHPQARPALIRGGHPTITDPPRRKINTGRPAHSPKTAQEHP
jgi:DoxX-like family